MNFSRCKISPEVESYGILPSDGYAHDCRVGAVVQHPCASNAARFARASSWRLLTSPPPPYSRPHATRCASASRRKGTLHASTAVSPTPTSEPPCLTKTRSSGSETSVLGLRGVVRTLFSPARERSAQRRPSRLTRQRPSTRPLGTRRAWRDATAKPTHRAFWERPTCGAHKHAARAAMSVMH